jgi:hypothetical protein
MVGEITLERRARSNRNAGRDHRGLAGDFSGIRILPITALAPQSVRVSNAMAFFWLLFSGCAVLAWLVGYGVGYLKGVRDTIPADIRDDDGGFSGDWSGRETGAP